MSNTDPSDHNTGLIYIVWSGLIKKYLLYIFYLQGTLVQLSIEAIFNPGMTHCRRVALGPCNLLLWRVFLRLYTGAELSGDLLLRGPVTNTLASTKQ